MYFGRLSIILLVVSFAAIDAAKRRGKPKIRRSGRNLASLAGISVPGCGCESPILDILNTGRQRAVIEPYGAIAPLDIAVGGCPGPVIDVPNYRYVDPLEINPLACMFPSIEIPSYGVLPPNVEYFAPVVDLPCGCPGPMCGCRAPAVKLPSSPYGLTSIEIPQCGCQNLNIPAMSAIELSPYGYNAFSAIEISPCGCQGLGAYSAIEVPSCGCGLNIPAYSAIEIAQPCGCQAINGAPYSYGTSVIEIPAYGSPAPLIQVANGGCRGSLAPSCGCQGPCGCAGVPVSQCGCPGIKTPCGCLPAIEVPVCGCGCGKPGCTCGLTGTPCGLPGCGCGCGCNGKYLRQVTLQPPFL